MPDQRPDPTASGCDPRTAALAQALADARPQTLEEAEKILQRAVEAIPGDVAAAREMIELAVRLRRR